MTGDVLKRTLLGAIGVFALGTSAIFAQGGPPMITDVTCGWCTSQARATRATEAATPPVALTSTTALSNAGNTTAATQTAQRARNIRGLGVFDRNHFRVPFQRHQDVVEELLTELDWTTVDAHDRFDRHTWLAQR